MEKTGCKIICGAPTTLAVKELTMMMTMMMMMMIIIIVVVVIILRTGRRCIALDGAALTAAEAIAY